MRPSQKQITPEQLAFAQAHALVRIVDDEADLREALSFVPGYGRMENGHLRAGRGLLHGRFPVGAGLRGARRAHAGHERD